MCSMRRFRSISLILACLAANAASHADTALLAAPHAAQWAPAADALARAAAEAGYTVERVDFDALCNRTQLDPARAPLLILPDASTLPAESLDYLLAYLRGGGDLLAGNTPLGRTLLLRDRDGWVTREEYAQAHAAVLLEHTLFDFSGEAPLEGWRRTSNDMDIATTHEIVPGPPGAGSRALHVRVPKLTSWDTFVTENLDQPFPEGHTLTVLYAKGGPDTTELLVEWNEKDGSRWMATVPLTTEWRQYVLQPPDFHFWESVPARAGTAFDPANAAGFSVGLAHSHTALRGERHEYWLGATGTARRTPGHEKLITSYHVSPLDTLAPAYKFYPAADVRRAFAREGHAFLGAGEVPLPASFQCVHPRPGAAGFGKGRDWRWLPLLETEGADKDWRGAFATLFVNNGGRFAGSVWASFAVDDPAWYTQAPVLGVLRQTLARLRGGLFLIDGGADHFTYFEDQPLQLGATVVNCSGEAREAGISLVLERGDGTAVMENTVIEVGPGETARVTAERPARAAGEGGSASVSLMDGGTVIDRAEHAVHTWRPRRNPRYMTVENGDFMLNGARWRPHGVNYMPSSGIGTEDQNYFEHWIGARAYDPEIIERDLRRVKAMGMNAVSVFIYHESMEAQNLLDLLRLCEELDLHVNLSLRPGTPLEFEWDKMRELITYYRLAERDIVFALDLAWEPMFGDHDERKRWDAAWNEWVVERYGSVEAAEADWDFAAPHDAGAVTNPLGHMTTTDGPWRRYVAAYRRFLDTLLYEYYRRAYDLVRGLDPHHLISFRMTEAGNPTFNWDKRIPYDFPCLAAAVDILEPEAYGRIGDWEKVKPGWFGFEYARWAAPQLPYMWAEAGVHVWAQSAMTQSADLLDFQAEYYGHLYRMFIESAADGIFFWWYPGGYRVNERSDYGIINPDGTDRPVTHVIREHADALIHGPDAREITHWLEIDRDKHPAGVNGIYEEHKEAFWALIEAGHGPGLRTEATGTDSTNCPLTAVGNVPFNGNNPPKYLDGFFDRVEVRTADGEWTTVPRGGTARVTSGQPAEARVTIVNLAEAAWKGGAQREGRVCVRAVAGEAVVDTPLPRDLARHERLHDFTVSLPQADDAPLNVIITFNAEGRATFGPKFPLRLIPR